MGDTEISWTHRPGTRGRSWNPGQGCSRESEGCRNCYAERMAARFAVSGWSQGLINLRTRKWNGTVRLAPHKLAEPLSWREPSTVFVDSMTDIFHPGYANEEIAAVFGVMAATQQHTHLMLTKRARRMREWFEWAAKQKPDAFNTCIAAADRLTPGATVAHFYGRGPWPLPNVWLGVSVENQEAADERIPELLRTPAAVRFLSCEPLIGPVDLTIRYDAGCGVMHNMDALRGYGGWPGPRWEHKLHWIIAGCESGPGARPCSVEWLRSLRDQCAAAGVPYFLKQAVETDPGRCGDADNPNGDEPCGQRIRVFVNGPGDGSWSCGCTVEGAEFGAAVDVGFGDGSKRKPGGVIELPYLDGVQHAAFPEVTDA